MRSKRSVVDRKLNSQIKLVDRWLIQQALAKARRERNTWHEQLITAIRIDNMSPADRDLLNSLLEIPEDTMVRIELVRADLKNGTSTALHDLVSASRS